MDDPPAIVARYEKKITREDVDRILSEENGASALIVLMRNDAVDPDLVIDAITRFQNQPASKGKRMIMALIETLFPA